MRWKSGDWTMMQPEHWSGPIWHFLNNVPG
jgi:hypothetical protein